MRVENPFRGGDHVIYVGRRHYALTDSYLKNNGPVKGVVRGIWQKNGRRMVDVDFPTHGAYCCYAEELQFDVLDTLGAL